jgi:hypothetical protein
MKLLVLIFSAPSSVNLNPNVTMTVQESYSDCRIEKRYLRVSGTTVGPIRKKSLIIRIQAIRTTTLDEFKKGCQPRINLLNITSCNLSAYFQYVLVNPSNYVNHLCI